MKEKKLTKQKQQGLNGLMQILKKKNVKIDGREDECMEEGMEGNEG